MSESELPSDHTTSATSEDGLPRARRRRRRAAVLIAVLGLVVVALALVGYRWQQRSAVGLREVPEVDVTDVDVAIVDVVRTARQAVLDRPRRADAWGHFAMVLYAHEKLSEAVDCFEQAEELDPRDYRWPYLRGMILAEHNTADGLPHVRRAVALAPPDDGSLRLRLAELLFDVRELPESEAIFREILAGDPDNPRARLGLARVLSVEGDPEEALRWAAGAARALPEMRAVHELLSRLYYRVGNQEAAAKQQQMADRLPHENLMWPDPVLAEVLLLRVDTHWRSEMAHRYLVMGKPDQYIDALRRLVADHPQDPTLQAQLGRTMLNIKNLPAARGVLEDALRRHPSAVDIRLLWGTLHYEEQEYPQAVEICRSVVELKPDYPEAWNALAACQRALGDVEGAIGSYRQVLQFEPLAVEAYFSLAELLWQAGRRAEAREQLRAGLGIDPSHPGGQRLQSQFGRQ